MVKVLLTQDLGDLAVQCHSAWEDEEPIFNGPDLIPTPPGLTGNFEFITVIDEIQARLPLHLKRNGKIPASSYKRHILDIDEIVAPPHPPQGPSQSATLYLRQKDNDAAAATAVAASTEAPAGAQKKNHLSRAKISHHYQFLVFGMLSCKWLSPRVSCNGNASILSHKAPLLQCTVQWAALQARVAGGIASNMELETHQSMAEATQDNQQCLQFLQTNNRSTSLHFSQCKILSGYIDSDIWHNSKTA